MISSQQIRDAPHAISDSSLHRRDHAVDAAVQALQQAHLNIASAGGAIQTLAPGTTRAVILHAPDDLLIQVVK